MQKDFLGALSDGISKEECLAIVMCGDVSVAVGAAFPACVKCAGLLLVEPLCILQVREARLPFHKETGAGLEGRMLCYNQDVNI